MNYECPGCGYHTYNAGEPANPVCGNPKCGKTRSEVKAAVKSIPGEFDAMVRRDVDPERFGGWDKFVVGGEQVKPGDRVRVSVKVSVRRAGEKMGVWWPLDEARDLLEPFEQELVELRSFARGEEYVPGRVEVTGQLKSFMAFPHIKAEDIIKIEPMTDLALPDDTGEGLVEAIEDANREIMESSGKANVECTLTDHWRMKYLDAAGRVARLVDENKKLRDVVKNLREFVKMVNKDYADRVAREMASVSPCVVDRKETQDEE